MLFIHTGVARSNFVVIKLHAPLDKPVVALQNRSRVMLLSIFLMTELVVFTLE